MVEFPALMETEFPAFVRSAVQMVLLSVEVKLQHVLMTKPVTLWESGPTHLLFAVVSTLYRLADS